MNRKRAISLAAFSFTQICLAKEPIEGIWKARVTDSSFDYMEISNQHIVLTYSSEQNEIEKGYWEKKNDSLRLRIVESEYEDSEQSSEYVLTFQKLRDTLWFRSNYDPKSRSYWYPPKNETDKYLFTKIGKEKMDKNIEKRLDAIKKNKMQMFSLDKREAGKIH